LFRTAPLEALMALLEAFLRLSLAAIDYRVVAACQGHEDETALAGEAVAVTLNTWTLLLAAGDTDDSAVCWPPLVVPLVEHYITARMALAAIDAADDTEMAEFEEDDATAFDDELCAFGFVGGSAARETCHMLHSLLVDRAARFEAGAEPGGNVHVFWVVRSFHSLFLCRCPRPFV
jgi:hypothetical protein